MTDDCSAGGQRGLTSGEIALIGGVFGAAIDCSQVRIRRRRWWPFQPRSVTMAPMGHLHFAPASPSYCNDFSAAPLSLQGHFIHEMTHIWQTQRRGRWYLPIHRHPFCRYHYNLRPGAGLTSYGIEQQAEIVRHGFLIGRGLTPPGSGDPEAYPRLLNFAQA